MEVHAPLYNVNSIVVKRGLEKKYIQFSHRLNNYLKERYGKYYISLQLYENNLDPSLFYVIAAYYDIQGIEIAAVEIGNKIDEIYEEVWGDEVQRIHVFRFLDYTRISPPQEYKA